MGRHLDITGQSGYDDLREARLRFRELFRKYHVIDLIGDENEAIEWFRQTMLELADWVGKREQAQEILRRFREEWGRRRAEQERFERAVSRIVILAFSASSHGPPRFRLTYSYTHGEICRRDREVLSLRNHYLQ